MFWAELSGTLGAAVFGAAAVPLAFAWLRRAQLRSEDRGDAMVMGYPSALAWMGGIVVAFFFGIALVSQVFFIDDTSTLKGLFFFVGFGLMGLYLVAEATLIHHRITEEGLIHRSPFRAPTLIRWRDIRSIRFSRVSSWYVLKTKDTTARISIAMTGQVLFADTLIRRATQAEIDPATREILKCAAAGDPPRPFG